MLANGDVGLYLQENMQLTVCLQKHDTDPFLWRSLQIASLWIRLETQWVRRNTI